jgi:hypothetical protein
MNAMTCYAHDLQCKCLRNTGVLQVASVLGSVWPSNQTPNRAPNFQEPKTEAKSKNRKNQNFGSVRLDSVQFTVFSTFFPVSRATHGHRAGRCSSGQSLCETWGQRLRWQQIKRPAIRLFPDAKGVFGRRS